MANKYWDAVESSPDRLLTSLGLLVAPPVSLEPQTYAPETSAGTDAPGDDLSDVAIDESGLDFLTEYRAGLPDIAPEPNPEPVEVPDPVPSGVVPQPAGEPDEIGADVGDEHLGAGEFPGEPGELGELGEPEEPESDAGEDSQALEPQIIYVRDYPPGSSVGSEGQLPGDSNASSGDSAQGRGAQPEGAQTGVPPIQDAALAVPQVQHPPLAPIAIPTSNTGAGAGVAPAAQQYRGPEPLVLPTETPAASHTTHINAKSADVHAEHAHIAGLENFDPSLYLDFDDQQATSKDGEPHDSEDDDGADATRSRRIFADFGAGKRITQTENPAQAMRVLRELTVFRD